MFDVYDFYLVLKNMKRLNDSILFSNHETLIFVLLKSDVFTYFINDIGFRRMMLKVNYLYIFNFSYNILFSFHQLSLNLIYQIFFTYTSQVQIPLRHI